MGKSNKVWILRRLSAAALAAALATAPACAQSDNSNIWQRPELLGNIGGLRTALGNAGITFGLNDSENLLANLSGGVKTGATMQGVTTMSLDVDTAKAVGLPGGKLHISALQIHGQPLSPAYLDNLQTANGNESENATRLWELWYDQSFAKGMFDLKIGQQSVDNEFIDSKYSALFVNTMAGWPLVPSADLYGGGGPAYPLSSLGVRGRFKPNGNTAILAGVFDDNPGGGSFGSNAQALDAAGGKFNLNTGALWIAELQYATTLFGLPGTYKIGGWYDSGFFPDQLYSTDGLTLANPASNGNPVMHRGNYSLYGVVDQTVWQSSTNNARNVNVFGRIMGAPADENLITLFFNGGVTMAAPLPGRNNDQLGLDFGIGKVSSRAASLDRAAGMPPRGAEELVELTYQAQLAPWLVVQPDMQYVINPGGGVLDPNDTTHNLRNEFVAGIRVVASF